MRNHLDEWPVTDDKDCKSRREILKIEPPRGEWRVCIHKLTGQPYIGRVIERILDDTWCKTGIPFYYIHIPQLNQEITSDTYNWEIL